MRLRRSTALQSAMFFSLLLHGGALAGLLFSSMSRVAPPPEAMEVFSVDARVLDDLQAQLPEFERAAPSPPSTRTPEQVAALPRETPRLLEHVPTPDAVTDLQGQIVELADPLQKQVAPEQADYLSRAHHRVESESASRQYRVNPAVVAPTYSTESSQASRDAGDAQALREGAPDLAPGAPQVARAVAARLPEQGLERVSTSPPPGMSGRAPGGARSAGDATPTSATETAPGSSPPAPDRHPDDVPRSDPLPRAGNTPAEAGDDAWRGESPRRLLNPLLGSPSLARLQPGLRPDLEVTPVPPETDPRAESAVLTSDGAGRSREPRAAETQVALVPRAGAQTTPREVPGAQGQGGGEGGTAPISLRQGELRGAPSNDRLREKTGDSTLLNAREFKYFGYMQLIRRQVNFYWTQALSNITRVNERLTRSEYTTVLNVTLDRDGNLRDLAVVRGCGVKSFDEATVQAFQIAAPFPPPPPGMLNSSGLALLPEFGYTVTLSPPAPRYSGIDPRANVLFPGIVHPQ